VPWVQADEQNTRKYGFYGFHKGRKLAALAAFACVFYKKRQTPSAGED
jgi:hypothetical protein